MIGMTRDDYVWLGMTRDHWDDQGRLGMARDEWEDKGCLGITGMTRDD